MITWFVADKTGFEKDEISRRRFLRGLVITGLGIAAGASGVVSLERLFGKDLTLISAIYGLAQVNEEGFPDKSMKNLSWKESVLATKSLLERTLRDNVYKTPESKFQNPTGVKLTEIGVVANSITDPMDIFMANLPGQHTDSASYFQEMDGSGNIVPADNLQVLKDMVKIAENPGTQAISLVVEWEDRKMTTNEINDLLPDNMHLPLHPDGYVLKRSLESVIHPTEALGGKTTTLVVEISRVTSEAHTPDTALQWSLSKGTESAFFTNYDKHEGLTLNDKGFLDAARRLCNNQ